MIACRYKIHFLFPMIICGLLCIVVFGYINTKVKQIKMNSANKELRRENENVYIQSNETAGERRINWTWFHSSKFISQPLAKLVVTRQQVIYLYY